MTESPSVVIAQPKGCAIRKGIYESVVKRLLWVRQIVQVFRPPSPPFGAYVILKRSLGPKSGLEDGQLSPRGTQAPIPWQVCCCLEVPPSPLVCLSINTSVLNGMSINDQLVENQTQLGERGNKVANNLGLSCAKQGLICDKLGVSCTKLELSWEKLALSCNKLCQDQLQL